MIFIEESRSISPLLFSYIPHASASVLMPFLRSSRLKIILTYILVESFLLKYLAFNLGLTWYS
jgi:hypothetical protein